MTDNVVKEGDCFVASALALIQRNIEAFWRINENEYIF